MPAYVGKKRAYAYIMRLQLDDYNHLLQVSEGLPVGVGVGFPHLVLLQSKKFDLQRYGVLKGGDKLELPVNVASIAAAIIEG